LTQSLVFGRLIRFINIILWGLTFEDYLVYV